MGEKECCSTCTKKLRLEKSDYSQGGCKHSWPSGFICLAFANEGIATWMIGLDPDSEDICEMYMPKEKS